MCVKGVLSEERQKRLEAKGMKWLTNAWDEGVSHFKAVPLNEDGQRMVPPLHVTDDGYNLGSWQNVQRQNYKRGTLDAERVALLESLGIVWDPFDAAWELGFEAFLRFKPTDEGVRLIAQTYVDAEGFKLGAWQAHQRQLYKRGTLGDERVAKLEANGVVWDPFEIVWQDSFSRFLEFPPGDDGKRRVPQVYKCADGFRLGAWQTTQRTTYHRGLMTQERWEKLEKAGIVWTAREQVPVPPKKGECKSKKRRLARAERRLLDDAAVQAFDADPTTDPRIDPATSPDADALSWHAEWRERLSCWWIALPAPTQTTLGECMGALSLHLGSRCPPPLLNLRPPP